jgi:hypothetical protein
MPVRYSDQSAGPSTRRAKDDDPVPVEMDYSAWPKAELQYECGRWGLSTSGTKAELIARLSA